MADFIAEISGSHNTWIRMVLGDWEMAASMVATSAIDPTKPDGQELPRQ
jgi:hypothetical protein